METTKTPAAHGNDAELGPIRDATEAEYHAGRHCANCTQVRTHFDDMVYICDPRGVRVSDMSVCGGFNNGKE